MVSRTIAAPSARRGSVAAWLILAGIVLFWSAGCAPALHASAFPSVRIKSDVTHFESEGQRIRVDVYRPEGAGPRPAAIVAHGSSGVHTWIPNTATRYAKALAEQGLIAFVVHYFDATGTIMASRSAEATHYFTWLRVLSDAVAWVSSYPDVDKNQIGMLGHSLGAFLAVGAAAFDPRINRIVLFGGGLEPFLADNIKRMPPTLVCHGDKDGEVSIVEATQLVDFLEAHRWEVELIVYPDEEHTFSDSIAADALTSAARFLTSGHDGLP